eukprot:CAMPEP_0201485846 /NCGR_PEP_ID=MMETSP0151_2-20130828/9942_1 /ASSEMBLY_ACC=CAM_ASM_000257 /TAXON_ID=200890 /ORGANISM="Paramoeba atlantica, Strain 621/1 / CCAP 1560/9" /LENGTH=349 /DNA_ID=CAMNT_0047870169 /DNA_START=51 /DNA_END=1100 /DNA_ORIENTATION=-
MAHHQKKDDDFSQSRSLISYTSNEIHSQIPAQLPKLTAEEAKRDKSEVQPSQNYSHIKNKERRTALYKRDKKREKKEKKKEKVKKKRERERLGDEAPAKKIPHTIENTRKIPETAICEEDEEEIDDEKADEFASYFVDGLQPKVIVTTSRHASKHAKKFADHLAKVIPSGEYFNRRTFTVKTMVTYAIKHNYTDLLVVNENKKKINRVLHCHLPDGPTACYKISSIKYGKEIPGHAKPTRHDPEIVLNHFTTKLARKVGRMLACLFPQKPNFHGRRVITFHNQRDFIFFRHHRYIFDDSSTTRLQECGPRFTLKLQSLQYGRFDPTNEEYEWIYKPQDIGKSKKDFFMF